MLCESVMNLSVMSHGDIARCRGFHVAVVILVSLVYCFMISQIMAIALGSVSIGESSVVSGR